MTADLPVAVVDLAQRLGATATSSGASVHLMQKGRMKRALGSDTWLSFSARQTMATRGCDFEWCAAFLPFGLLRVCDALEQGKGRLDVTALRIFRIVRMPSTPALVRGELMRYLAELPWAPDAILHNRALRWRVNSPDSLVVAAGDGDTAVEVTLGLDGEGRIATTYAANRPRSAVEPILPTPWRGRFSDYRRHHDHWLPFAGEVAWEIDGRDETYWRGSLTGWSNDSA